MCAVSKVVLAPNERKSNVDLDHFSPLTHFQKPLIYVTNPDNVENEIWFSPIPEPTLRTPGECSDDETSTYSDKSIELENDENSRDRARQSTTSIYDNTAMESNELWFYRTGWQNRGVYSSNKISPKLMYYADIPWTASDTKLTIRRGTSTGPVVADVNRSGPGSPLEITLLDPQQRPYLQNNGKLILRFGCIYSRTHKFTYRGRNLAWKCGFLTCRLGDLDTDEIIAKFYSKTLSIHKDGKMVILGEYAKDPQWVDVIVTTALTCQQREREVKRRAGGGS